MLLFTKLLFIGFSYVVNAGSLSINPSNEIEIVLTDVRKKGVVFIGIYNEKEGFTKPAQAYKKTTYNTNGEKTVLLKFSGLGKGSYAIAVFQDLNNNNKLDKNLFGIPTEPYAFSNNVKPKLSAPTYDDCKFSIPGQAKHVIHLLNP